MYDRNLFSYVCIRHDFNVAIAIYVATYLYVLFFCMYIAIGYSTNLSDLNMIANEASTNSVFRNSSIDETGSMSKSIEMEYLVNIQDLSKGIK